MVDMDDFSDVLENLDSAANPVKFTTIQHHCHFKVVGPRYLSDNSVRIRKES